MQFQLHNQEVQQATERESAPRSQPGNAWATTQTHQDNSKLDSVRGEAQTVKQAMGVVKEQKRKLQTRMHELKVAREEWKSDMAMCADEPSGESTGQLLVDVLITRCRAASWFLAWCQGGT